MSPKKASVMRTIRGVDVTIRYTSDDLVDSLINQRQFFDQDNTALLPVTSKLLERHVQPSTPSISRLVGIDPRFVKVCFGSVANISGESNFQVIIPYAPGDAGHKEHLREIFAYVSFSANINPSTPLNVGYYGENRN